MKPIILMSVAMLGIAATAPATAQQPPDASGQISAAQADPNAGQPTGAVPATTGMVPAPASVPRDPAAPIGTAANPVTIGGNMTPPPAGGKNYPLCSRTVQDSCVNPGEAGKRLERG